MTDQPGPSDAAPQQRPTYNPAAPHHQRPRIRRVRGFPLQAQGPDGKSTVMLGLADQQQVSAKMVATLPAVQVILPLMDGTRDLGEIVAQVGRGLTREFLENLVAQLDDAALIQGPTFDRLLADMKTQFDSTDVLPPGGTAQFAEALVVHTMGQDATEEQKTEHGPSKLREHFDKLIAAALKDAADPAFDALPTAVVVPHVDYNRGGLNYAHVYGRMRTNARPDRVVILGTNHFGFSTGVCGCDKGFESPLGISPADSALLERVKARLGSENSTRLLEHRYDHEREHSIELQIPWIQHCLGPGDDGGHIPVFAALIHDPCVNGGESYDGSGLALQPFIDALAGALDEVGGRTLIISSADLSHVGPAFGDQQPLSGDAPGVAEARNRVVQHDREMLRMVAENKPDDLVASMSWQQNPTRWCSVGNIVCAMKVARPTTVRLLNYGAAVDGQGMTMVSHVAIAMN